MYGLESYIRFYPKYCTLVSVLLTYFLSKVRISVNCKKRYKNKLREAILNFFPFNALLVLLLKHNF